MKVSVIVPVYNVEAFIGRCAISLMEQTLQEVEYIFVDDCSPDGSIAKLKEVIALYPHRTQCVQIVSHLHNQGLPAARNTGLARAMGEYVFHCDSDDWVEKDMLEKLYAAAVEKEADMVWCDWYLSFEQNERYMKQPDYATAEEALKGMLAGTMKYNVWNKLVKRSLYTDNQIQFPQGYGMGEDMTMIRLAACARRVAYVAQAFYHYIRLNTEAFTRTYSEKNLKDLRHNADETMKFISQRAGDALGNEIAYFQLNTKFPFLITNDKQMYRLWNEWYPESNSHILANPYVSVRFRLLQFAAAQKWYGLVGLYYVLFSKFIYCMIYT